MITLLSVINIYMSACLNSFSMFLYIYFIFITKNHNIMIKSG
jgi:hypothetical protein